MRRRAKFIRSLRKLHGWLGLWGAAMGLFFGATGIIMNHRAILPVPLKKIERTVIQVALPDNPESPQHLINLIGERLDNKLVPRIRVVPTEEVNWYGSTLRQPEKWIITFDRTGRSIEMEYWRGDKTVKLTQSDGNFIAILTRLHMAIGVDAVWVLVADSVAGSLIVLSITGLLLWSQMNAWRLTSIAVALGAMSLALWRALLAV